MREGLKPHELLSSKGKEGFKICSDILKDTSYVLTFPGVSQLREDATKLYERLSSMDMEHDDKYYQVDAEIERLQKAFDEIMVKTGWANMEYGFDPEKDSIEDTMRIVKRYIHNKTGAMFSLVHKNQDIDSDVPYSDRIEMRMHKKEKQEDVYFLDIEEVFDDNTYKTAYRDALHEVLEKRYNRRMKDMATVIEHRHMDGPMQYSAVFQGLNPKEAEDIIREVLEVVKANPRQTKVKK